MTSPSQPVQKNVFRFSVEGMTCDHCKRAVENAARAVPGVSCVTVDLDRGIADVSGRFAEHEVVHAIEGEGYAVKPISLGESG